MMRPGIRLESGIGMGQEDRKKSIGECDATTALRIQKAQGRSLLWKYEQ